MKQSTFEKELKKNLCPLNECEDCSLEWERAFKARDKAMEEFEKDIDDLNSFLKKGLPFDAIKVLVKKHFGGKQ